MVWAWQQLQNGEFANLALGLAYDTAKASKNNVYVFTYYFRCSENIVVFLD